MDNQDNQKKTIIFLDISNTLATSENHLLCKEKGWRYNISQPQKCILDLLIKKLNGQVVLTTYFDDHDYDLLKYLKNVENIDIHDDYKINNDESGFDLDECVKEIESEFFSCSQLYRKPNSDVYDYAKLQSDWIGWKIKSWLNEHNGEYEDFLIIDCDPDNKFLSWQKDNLIKIDGYGYGYDNGGLLLKYVEHIL